MALLEAPLLSLDARGRLGTDTIYSSWKGRPYAKPYSTPDNPNSAAQNSQRLMFRFLAEAWLHLPTDSTSSWSDPAIQRRITPSNAFLSHNLNRWTHFQTPQQAHHTSPSSTPLTLTNLEATPGYGSLDFSATASSTTSLWGFIIFLTSTPGSTLSPLSCISILHRTTTATILSRCSHINAGQYYLTAFPFNIDGIQGTSTEFGPLTIP